MNYLSSNEFVNSLSSNEFVNLAHDLAQHMHVTHSNEN